MRKQAETHMCAVGAATEPTASKRLAFGMSFKAFVMISLCKTSVFSSKILMLILLSPWLLLAASVGKQSGWVCQMERCFGSELQTAFLLRDAVQKLCNNHLRIFDLLQERNSNNNRKTPIGKHMCAS